jgi:hypothetical protein
MLTVPGAFAGATATILLDAVTVKLVAGVEPNLTAVTPTKFDPLIVTLVPPFVEPLEGLIELTLGAATYVYRLAAEAADIPPTAANLTLTVPDERAGAVA